MKLNFKCLSLIMLFTLPSFKAQAAKPILIQQCKELALNMAVKNVQDFEYNFSKYESLKNLVLKTMGIKEQSTVRFGLIYSQNYQRTLFEFLDKIKNSEITNKEIENFKMKLGVELEKAVPSYIQKCVEVSEKMIRSCKVTVEQKEFDPAQRICLAKRAPDFEIPLKVLNYKVWDDMNKASETERAFLTDIENQNSDNQKIANGYKERVKYKSNIETFLPQVLYISVRTNNKAYMPFILSKLKTKEQRTAFINSFNDKNHLMEFSLGNKDHDYLKFLIKLGVFNKADKEKLVGMTSNPEALKIILGK